MLRSADFSVESAQLTPLRAEASNPTSVWDEVLQNITRFVESALREQDGRMQCMLNSLEQRLCGNMKASKSTPLMSEEGSDGRHPSVLSSQDTEAYPGAGGGIDFKDAKSEMRVSTTWRTGGSGAVFILRQPWLDQEDADGVLEQWGKSSTGIDFYNQRWKRVASMQTLDAPTLHSWARHAMLHPSGGPRLSWDVLSLLVLLYDSVLIPYELAFQPPEDQYWVISFLAVLIFWTLDVPISFSTGFYKNGVEELRRLQVAWNYIRTWFCLDLAILMLDWTSLVIDHSRENGFGLFRFGKTLRTFRVVRSLRLVRVLKLQRVAEAIQDHINSEIVQIVLTMVKLILLVLLVNHGIACLWYAVGMTDGETDRGWADSVKDDSLLYRYLTALHWTLSQFTPGAMEIHPGTVQERGFAVVTLVFALLIFSSFLSSITSAMTQLRRLASRQEQDKIFLQRYLKAKKIKANLSIRIMHYVEHQLSAQNMQVQESDVHLLQIISKPLEKELMQNLRQPFLERHPFFYFYSMADDAAMQSVCYDAMRSLPLSRGDLVFAPRCSDGQMFFVTKGVLKYTSGRRFSQVCRSYSQPMPDIAVQLLEVHDWCSEGALWTQWVYLGTLRASEKENAEVLAIKGDEFAKATIQHHHVRANVLQYGQSYVERLNEIALRPSSSNLTDLPDVELFPVKRFTQEAFGLLHTESIAQSWGRSLSVSTRRSARNSSSVRSPTCRSPSASPPLASRDVSPGVSHSAADMNTMGIHKCMESAMTACSPYSSESWSHSIAIMTPPEDNMSQQAVDDTMDTGNQEPVRTSENEQVKEVVPAELMVQTPRTPQQCVIRSL